MAKTKPTAPKPFCFVLMPFAQEFDDVYSLGIKEACTKAGAYCERVDEQIFHERILDRIYNQIATADIVIADMSGRNANVFYEVGYAHAIDKLTVLLTNNADDIPFDLKHFPHIVYGANDISRLKRELGKRIGHYVKNPSQTTARQKLGLDVFIEGINITTNNATISIATQGHTDLDLTLRSSSLDILETTDFKIGFILQHNLLHLEYYPNDSARQATLAAPVRWSETESLWVMAGFARLLPDESAVYDFPLRYWGGKFPIGTSQPVRVKVFSKQGSAEYQFNVIAISEEDKQTERMRRNPRMEERQAENG